jgi:hypothetical protein
VDVADVFISYKSEQRAFAQLVDKRLQAEGWTTWWDTSLTAGDRWTEVIREELAAARCVVVLWSRESWASQWVQSEALSGFGRGILVSARLDDVVIDIPFTGVQIADLTGRNRANGLADLVRGVARKAPRLAGAGAAAAAPQPRPAGPRFTIPKISLGPLTAIVRQIRQRWIEAAGLLVAIAGVWVAVAQGGLGKSADEPVSPGEESQPASDSAMLPSTPAAAPTAASPEPLTAADLATCGGWQGGDERWRREYLRPTTIGSYHVIVRTMDVGASAERAHEAVAAYAASEPGFAFEVMNTVNDQGGNERYAVVVASGLSLTEAKVVEGLARRCIAADAYKHINPPG